MSFLTPLFLLGGLAIAGPILFHLIRRNTRRRFTFSSLMFLRPEPPRVTRKSRLEDIPLLIARCILLGLLVLAFARPFFRELVEPSPGDGDVRRSLLLVDLSASMRSAAACSMQGRVGGRQGFVRSAVAAPAASTVDTSECIPSKLATAG